MSGYVTTPNLGLRKPTVGGDDDLWGGDLNANADTLDAAVATRGYVDGRRQRIINTVTASIPNVGASTAEEVAVVWALPAALLAQAGDVLHVVVKAQFAATTDSKSVRVRLGPTSTGLGNSQLAICTCNTAGAVGAPLESWVIKTGTNAQKSWFWTIQAGNSVTNNDAALTLTDTGVLYLSITVQNSTAAAAASLTIFAALAEYMPAV